MPIDDIDGKSHKAELISSKNYSTNHIKSKSCHCSYLWPRGHAFTHQIDFKKPVLSTERNFIRVSGKAGHEQDADTNLDANSDTDLNISFCHADFVFVNSVFLYYYFSYCVHRSMLC